MYRLWGQAAAQLWAVRVHRRDLTLRCYRCKRLGCAPCVHDQLISPARERIRQRSDTLRHERCPQAAKAQETSLTGRSGCSSKPERGVQNKQVEDERVLFRCHCLMCCAKWCVVVQP